MDQHTTSIGLCTIYTAFLYVIVGQNKTDAVSPHKTAKRLKNFAQKMFTLLVVPQSFFIFVLKDQVCSR